METPSTSATTSTSTVNTGPLPTSKALTSVEIMSTKKFTTVNHSTSTIIPHSTSALGTTLSPTSQCENCQCIGGTCEFNVTLGRCLCHCQEFVFGDVCSLGMNDTKAHVDTGALPTRKSNFTLEISVTFQPAFNNLSSPQSLEFIKTLEKQLEALCREADPQSFKEVQVIKLSEGSVVAESVAVYNYLNNETQIDFVNNQLEGVLTNILNDTKNLKNISKAFNNSAVLLNGVTFQPPNITNITQLEPFINCSQFVGYTAEIVNGLWQCAGPCKTNPDYCHQHGRCDNDIHRGPLCSCFSSSLEQFYGPQCELFRRGPGFWGALFGSLAGALLIFIIIVIAVIVKKRHMRIWKRSNSYNRRLSAFEEDFFDFSNTGGHNLGFAGTYTPRFQPTTRRPEVRNVNP
ncbi:mucin-3B-like [Centropristis striata]|uniref:mucin-3B-like n=1 Tax=Centropristis striata TaxID=184440 RepID=UPI0027DF8F37|nr:mucin-3B-like [Centropristis striata]